MCQQRKSSNHHVYRTTPLPGIPRGKAVIVGVHRKKGEKEITGHGRIHFLESEGVDVDEIEIVNRQIRSHRHGKVSNTLSRQPWQDVSYASCHWIIGDLNRHAYEADARTETLCQIVRQLR
jgi:hypothetical protein